MNKQTITDFLKKNWFTLTLILAVILLVIFYTIGQKAKTKLIAGNAVLSAQNVMIQAGRDSLSAENKKLKSENVVIQHEKDSISLAKRKAEVQLAQMIRIHKREIDSLTNKDVPNDSLYGRLQPIYPNIDEEPLIFPFAGGQVRQIYATAISYPRIQKEYTLQTSILQGCNALNGRFAESEKNYQKQVDNLTKNIAAADEMIGNKDKQIKNTQKQLNRKTFWNWTYKAAAAALAAILIFR
ncbi:MAG: hypothetical protein PHQ91_15095 [Thermoanaerobaculaceae bacterium]|nr:hypothetical protein [Thermoanaerobaculaceae bacterium]